MAKFTIVLGENDSLNFIDFNGQMPEFLCFEDIFDLSQKEGRIETEEDIKSLCDGSDHQTPYFSKNTAEEEFLQMKEIYNSFKEKE